jgi:hypothetical protein
MDAVSRLPLRTLAMAVFGLGIAIGTLSDRWEPGKPPRAGDYVMLSGDFHVHAFPGDGALTPGALRDEAARAGLDVIAITNHNQIFTARWGERAAAGSSGPMVIAGQEITNPGYHMIAVGLQRVVDARQPVIDAAADVRAQGGVTIAAHPSRRAYGYNDDAAIASLDGTEVFHSDRYLYPNLLRGLTAFYDRVRRVKPGVAPIGSNDFHAGQVEPGRSRTYVFARERSAAGVIEAIRSGRTLAVDGNGRMIGDPSLIALADIARPRGRVDHLPGWRRVSVGLAWLGALGIVCLRGRRDRSGE